MDLLELKAHVFNGTLNPNEIAVVMFIALQDRSKYVFYKTVMMHALGIKDIRTLNHIINSLVDKKIIKQVMTKSRGFMFLIIGLDEDNGQDAEQEGKGSNEAAEGTAAGMKNEEPARVEGSAGSAVNDSAESWRSVSAGRDIKNKFTDLEDIADMPEDKREALADIMRGFA